MYITFLTGKVHCVECIWNQDDTIWGREEVVTNRLSLKNCNKTNEHW